MAEETQDQAGQDNAPLTDEQQQAKIDEQAKAADSVEAVDPNVGSATYEPLDQKSLDVQNEAKAASFDSDNDALQVKDLPPSGPIVEDQHVKLAKEDIEDRFSAKSKQADVDAEIALLESQGRIAGIGSNVQVDNQAKIDALKSLKK